MSDRTSVRNYAIGSHLLVILISSVSNLIVPTHKSDGFVSPQDPYLSQSFVDRVVHRLLGGLVRWDAQHFLHVSSHGYTYESNVAFFPLYPVFVGAVSSALSAISFALNPVSLRILTFVCVNFVTFVLGAQSLYDLILQLFRNRLFAKRVALFYCVSPASIFFVAPYSESVYAWLAFSGMLFWARDSGLVSAAFFCLATGTRSNGLTNIGFFLYNFVFSLFSGQCNLLGELVKLALYVVIIALPYILFQTYTFYYFCVLKPPNSAYPSFVVDYAYKNNLVLPSANISWCSNTLPVSYSYVQKHYWNVGFLSYFELKQIPNFLLASPILVLVSVYSLTYIYLNCNYLFNYSSQSKEHRYKLVLVWHALALSVFCFFFINVQVSTRLICSASPLLYLIAAERLDSTRVRYKTQFFKNLFPFCEQPVLKRRLLGVDKLANKLNIGWCIKWYFISYYLIGTVLFSNNYPWT